MARNFTAVGKMLVGMYGDEILRATWAKLVILANELIDEDLVPYMDPVKPKEGVMVAAAVKAAVYADQRARAEAAAAMPELMGPVKVVRWAEALRSQAIKNAEILNRKALRQRDELSAMRLDEYIAKTLRMEYRASWFIDNRMEFTDFPGIIKRRSVPAARPTGRASATEAEAVEEMTIRPARVRHPGAVEIRAAGQGVMALYACDFDFLRVVRSMRMRWNPDAQGWEGRVGGGTVSEQIGKLAQTMLAEGFAVMVSDDLAREKISGRKQSRVV